MGTTPGPFRAGARCLARMVLCAGLLAIPALGTPFTATGTISQFFSGGGDPGTGKPGNGPSGATWDHFFDNGSGLSALSMASASEGELKTLAVVQLDWLGWSSGSISSTAQASLREIVMPDWAAAAAHANDPGASSIIFQFGVDVTGSAGATSSIFGSAGASVEYDARIGDASASGSIARSSDGAVSISGTWGTVFLNATVPWNSNMYLDLSARSSAGASKTYLSFPTAEAIGDFSHTLRWGGVRRVWVVDAQGNSRELTGANIPLIGAETGFNYYHGVQGNSAVPEPSTMLLLAPGLLGVLWRRRRASL